jgi:hypothetical protein
MQDVEVKSAEAIHQKGEDVWMFCADSNFTPVFVTRLRPAPRPRASAIDNDVIFVHRLPG